jgi:hypothetical protein
MIGNNYKLIQSSIKLLICFEIIYYIMENDISNQIKLKQTEILKILKSTVEITEETTKIMDTNYKSIIEIHDNINELNNQLNMSEHIINKMSSIFSYFRTIKKIKLYDTKNKKQKRVIDILNNNVENNIENNVENNIGNNVENNVENNFYNDVDHHIDILQKRTNILNDNLKNENLIINEITNSMEISGYKLKNIINKII